METADLHEKVNIGCKNSKMQYTKYITSYNINKKR